MRISEPIPISDKEAAEARGLGRPKGGVAIIRERHHSIAKLLAQGISLAEISRLVGMTAAGVRAWEQNPANAELIAGYVAEARADFDSFLTQRKILNEENSLLAQMIIKERLLEAIETGAEIGIDKLVRIASNADDRTGLGKQETRVNLNMNIGARLDRAREAKKKAEAERAIAESPNVVKMDRRF